VLARQKAVVLGAFSAYKASPLDRGYTLKTAVAQLRATVCTATPVITGLPFGHVHPKVTLPVGRCRCNWWCRGVMR
jgi:muramoyltetrapeptide carboxypeptidase